MALLAHAGATFEIGGYGQLLTRKPPPGDLNPSAAAPPRP
jgi:hypothetical protein